MNKYTYDKCTWGKSYKLRQPVCQDIAKKSYNNIKFRQDN